MGIKWERRKLIYYSLEHVSSSSKSEVKKHADGQTSIHFPGSINSSSMTVRSQPSLQGSVRNYSASSVIQSLPPKPTSVENVSIHAQIKQFNFEQERLRLEEKQLDLRE